jgi:hypothetical protein
MFSCFGSECLAQYPTVEASSMFLIAASKITQRTNSMSLTPKKLAHMNFLRDAAMELVNLGSVLDVRMRCLEALIEVPRLPVI